MAQAKGTKRQGRDRENRTKRPGSDMGKRGKTRLMNMCLIIVATALSLLLGLAGLVAVVNTAWPAWSEADIPPLELDLSPLAEEIPDIDADAVAEQVSALIRLNTVSSLDHKPSHLDQAGQDAMLQAHGALKRFYPRLFSLSRVETVHNFSLLIELPGSDPSLLPALTMCHLDVAPVEDGTLQDWGADKGCTDCGPFSGKVIDGQVWGRGAMDMKSYCVGFLHAAEALLARNKGWVPKRTLMFAIGHDEEVGGGDGAMEIARLLEERGVEFEVLLDEGNPTMKGGSLSVNPTFDLALIGTAEKGNAGLELSCEWSGGHASYPSLEGTSASILAAAASRIALAKAPVYFGRPTTSLIATLAPTLPLPQRIVSKNLWLFRWLIVHQLLKNPITATTVRSTAALTMIHSGQKDNVLPLSASAHVNQRLVPGDTIADALARGIKAAADWRINVSVSEHGMASRDATEVSDHDSFGFQAIVGAIRQTQPGTMVAPSLFIAGTDSKHFTTVARKRIYRYYPFKWDSKDLSLIHTTDERVRVDDVVGAVRFFCFYLLAVSKDPGELPAPIPFDNPTVSKS